MTFKVIHNALVHKVQRQAICNCRITARVVIWSTPYFPNASIFLLMALGDLPENLGTYQNKTTFSRGVLGPNQALLVA